MTKPSTFTIQPSSGDCGKCSQYIDPRGHCWCNNNRDPIETLFDKFPNPFCDCSNPRMGREEVDVLRVLYESGATAIDPRNSPLVTTRNYIDLRNTYAVSWAWQNHGMEYPSQWDGPVVSLWSRLMIRPVQCAGGLTWMILTDDAFDKIKNVSQPKCKGAK